MRHAQVLVYESDGRLAELLREPARKARAALREPRRPQACLRLLHNGGAGVLVIRAGSDLAREMGLLADVSYLFPGVESIVVTDADDSPVTSLAWELGATYVLTPALPRSLLVDVVLGLLPAEEIKPSALAAPLEELPDDA